MLDFGGAYFHVFAALEHAQQQGLRLEGQFGDFVEEDGAAVGFFEITAAVVDGAGEGAFDVAEELGVDGPFRDAAAVDGDELAVPPAAVLMDDLRNVLLADAALARNEDGEVGLRKLHGRLEREVEGRIVADDVELVFQ